jgi:hypothetical protein
MAVGWQTPPEEKGFTEWWTHEKSTKTRWISLQQLYAVIAVFTHDDAPLAVDHNAPGKPELPVSSAFAADGSHVAAVAVAQHLHSMITRVSYNDVACTVKRDAVGTAGLTIYHLLDCNVALSDNFLTMVHSNSESSERSWTSSRMTWEYSDNDGRAARRMSNQPLETPTNPFVFMVLLSVLVSLKSVWSARQNQHACAAEDVHNLKEEIAGALEHHTHVTRYT